MIRKPFIVASLIPADMRDESNGPLQTQPDGSLPLEEGLLDELVSMLVGPDADQVVLSTLGIHFFKGKNMTMVGKLVGGLPSMLITLRKRAGMSSEERTGMLAAVGSGQLTVLRIDFASGKDGAEAALLRRPAAKNGWPAPMVPSGYQLAA